MTLTNMDPDSVDPLSEQVKKLASELQSAREKLASFSAERLETAQELQIAIEQIEATHAIVQSVSRELRSAQKDSAPGKRLSEDLAEVPGYIKTPLLVLGQDLRIRGFSNGAAVQLSLDLTCIGKRLDEVLNIRSFDVLRADAKHPIPFENRAGPTAGQHLYAIGIQRNSTDDPFGDLVLLIDIKAKRES